MFYGSTFEYGGTDSSTYGLVIADFNINNVEETPAFSPTVITDKPANSIHAIFGKRSYDEAPTFEMEVVSPDEITVANRCTIHKWLISPQGVLTAGYSYHGWGALKIKSSVISSYTYHALFTEVDDVYVNGRLVGFRLHGVLDSPYAYGLTSTLEVWGTDGYQTVSISVLSDIGYVYPTMELSVGGLDSGDALVFKNTTDSPYRSTILSDATIGYNYTMDAERRSLTTTAPTNPFGCFNRIWPRLVPGTNSLSIKMSSGSYLSISCPSYKMLGL